MAQVLHQAVVAEFAQQAAAGLLQPLGRGKLVRVLPARALGGNGAVNAGVTVVEHRPKDDLRLAAVYIAFYYLGLSA